MNVRDNWHVDAPWAQLVCSTEMPDDVTEKILELSDNILKENQQDPKDEDIVKAGGYRGDPTKETASYNWLKVPFWKITQEQLQECDVLPYLMQQLRNYMETILANGNVKNHLDITIPGGPHIDWMSQITEAWVVSQHENEYAPVHNHVHCKVSAVCYLKVPEKNSISAERDNDGQIVFTGMGGADPFSTSSHLNILPRPGLLVIYPSSLNHQVYPFRGSGERRAMAFNAEIMSVQQMKFIESLQKG